MCARTAATARSSRVASPSSLWKHHLGRKRRINPTSCNVDLSCLKGFCPSFVTVDGPPVAPAADPRWQAREADLAAALPAPDLARHAGPSLARAVRRHRWRRHRDLGRDPGDGGAYRGPPCAHAGFHRAGAEERRGGGACADRRPRGRFGCGAHTARHRGSDGGGGSGGGGRGRGAGAECEQRRGDRQPRSGGDRGVQARRKSSDRCGATPAHDRDGSPMLGRHPICPPRGWPSGCSATRKQ